MAADLKIFAFDPREYREAYETQGWLHVPNGLTDSFLATLSEFATASFGDHRVEGAAIGGRKEQALYEFQDRAELEELFDAISSICDLMRPSMTLSERHIKAYDADAPPDPPAHKDRYASLVSVGFSIDITRGSRLVLYPDDHRELNPFNISAALRANLEPEELPEAILPGAREVEIEDTAGDVVIFPGSSMWHLRRNPAGVVNLYLIRLAKIRPPQNAALRLSRHSITRRRRSGCSCPRLAAVLTRSYAEIFEARLPRSSNWTYGDRSQLVSRMSISNFWRQSTVAKASSISSRNWHVAASTKLRRLAHFAASQSVAR
jgi:hypothetical protein